MVAVEVHSGFMRCRQEGAWHFGAAEPPDDVTGVVRPVADFDKVVVRLGGEVEELDVSTWRGAVVSLLYLSLGTPAPLTQ